jgi:hypothetical protein
VEIGGANGYAGFSKNNEVITKVFDGLEDEDDLRPSKVIIKFRIGNNLETICINTIFGVVSVLGLTLTFSQDHS